MADFQLTSANDGTFLIRPVTARAQVWWTDAKIAERFVVDNTANDFAVILSENQQKVCNEIRQNNFDFIINISEDGWFGKSIGPKQHFDHSIFRAIETGKYVIRSSNNGMAAIINPMGQVEKKLDYGVSGYIDLENKRDSSVTLFSTYGNKIFLIIIFLYIFLTFSFNRIKNE